MIRLSDFGKIKLFHFQREIRPKRSIFVQTEMTMPLEIMVAVGKRFIVGIAQLGDKSATIERPVFPFVPPYEPEEIAKELLRKLGVPESEWDEILKTKKEIVI